REFKKRKITTRDLGGTKNQHEVQTPNKEILTEDNKQALVVQHEKQVQDTVITDTKTDMIDEVGEGPTQREGLNAKTMYTQRGKQGEAPEETTQAKTNNDTAEKNGMDLEVPIQISTYERQETTHVRDELSVLGYGNAAGNSD
ncbi:24242_t:CDS:2, partial [Gigaspora rosea]